MAAESLQLLHSGEECSLYRWQGPLSTRVQCYVVSTPETRAICNDPFITGIHYTSSLRHACTRILDALKNHTHLCFDEKAATILHILRGGLNFGLREALATAFGWNDHTSAFISAQRARISKNSSDWVITESEYKKLFFGAESDVIFGDVVATGTSLEHALHVVRNSAKTQGVQIRSLLFFTIGSPRSHEILHALDDQLRAESELYQGSSVVYLEGIFSVPTATSPLTIKIDGTDLLRTGSTVSPEFIESQYQNPAYPLERCAIYDAGSRAFHCEEYLADVREYWEATLQLAKDGMSFQHLLSERFPELDATRFSDISLEQVAHAQLQKAPS